MKVYILGVCGTAMAHVGILLRELGHEVYGSDSKFFPPISDLLKGSGIVTFEGYDANRLIDLSPDYVIVGNVVSRKNPEIEYLLGSKAIPFDSFPAFLNKNILVNRERYVVTGTHGKTTTSSLLAYILKENACEAGYFIGGIPENFKCGASIGSPTAPFVIEGDEYDTAFFDKSSKFMHYWPNMLIINNIEFDHGDIFCSLQDIQRAFYNLTKLVPFTGRVIYNGDDDNVCALLPIDWTNHNSVGFLSKNEWQIRNFVENKCCSSFDLYRNNKLAFEKISYPLFGEFNARNVAMAVIAAYYKDEKINIKPLENFSGVMRRQRLIYDSEILKIYDDFAHHPSAIKAILKSLNNLYGDYKLVVCFEPSCNTSASNYFETNMLDCFSLAHEVIFAPQKENVFTQKFVNSLRKMNVNTAVNTLTSNNIPAKAFYTFSDIESFFKTYNPSAKTILCCLSNGKLSSIIKNIISLK